MELYLDHSLIIAEVRKFPCLYDQKHFDFRNKVLQRAAWKAVTKNVLQEQYDQIDGSAKLYFEKVVQNKWRSLRSQFFRNLKSNKPNKKRYTHHRELSFLLQFHESSKEDADCPDNAEESNEQYTNDEHINFLQAVFEPRVTSVHSIPKKGVPSTEVSKSPSRVTQKPVIIRPFSSTPVKQTPDKSSPSRKGFKVPAKCLKPKTPISSQDPDRLFLKSQLPYIKTMNPDDKINFQIAFVQLIQKYSTPKRKPESSPRPPRRSLPITRAPSVDFHGEEQRSVMHLLSSFSEEK